MRIENLIVLSKIFNVSADYLLCLSDVKNPDPNVKAAVEYTGLDENNILLLHMLSADNETSEDAEASNGSKIAQTIQGLSRMDPTICKQGLLW